ncbi:MAG: flagellar protein FlaG [Firmicutes bacterium]|nr:flagellar protein FlaG [Bacillota bacterium]
MAVKGVGPVRGKQVDYTPEGVRGPSSYPLLNSQGEGGTSQGIGGPRKATASLRSAGSSQGELENAVAHLNATVDIFSKGLHFRIHEDTERIVVEVINKESGEVIRQIPPEYILDVLAKIDALLGVFIDERA